MKCVPFASRSLRTLVCPSPSRCPYCPADAPAHWTGWGSYQRYAGSRKHPSQRVVVPRYWCKVVERTFSLPPDALLPHCGLRTVHVLLLLRAMFVRNVAVNLLAGRTSIARGTSDTSGKAGGLRPCEPLKAVESLEPPKGGFYLKILSCSSRRSSLS